MAPCSSCFLILFNPFITMLHLRRKMIMQRAKYYRFPRASPLLFLFQKIKVPPSGGTFTLFSLLWTSVTTLGTKSLLWSELRIRLNYGIAVVKPPANNSSPRTVAFRWVQIHTSKNKKDLNRQMLFKSFLCLFDTIDIFCWN